MMHEFDIRGYSYDERSDLLPAVTTAITEAGGWVLEQKPVSCNAVSFYVEIQLGSIVDFYSSVLATGLEITRSSHFSLTELCTFREHFGGSGARNVVRLRLEVTLLEELSIHSLLMAGSSIA